MTESATTNLLLWVFPTGGTLSRYQVFFQRGVPRPVTMCFLNGLDFQPRPSFAMAHYPSQFDESFAVAHPPLQILISERRRLLLVPRGEPIGNSLIAMPVLDDDFELIYFDGLQMLAIKKQEIDHEREYSITDCEIMVADLNG